MERTDLEQWKAREVARLLALVETERRYYQELIAILPVPVAVLSADRNVVSSNRAFRQTLRVTTNDLRGKTIDQILPSHRLIEKIRDVHATGVSQAVPVEREGRQFHAIVAVIRNPDDENEVETLLVLQEAGVIGGAPAPAVPHELEPAAELLEIPAVIWEADAATLEFHSVDGDGERLLGFPDEHWTTTPKFFEERIHPEDRTATLDFYRAAFAKAGDASAEFRAETAAGGTIWVRETIRIKGRVLTGVMTSIAQRKQLEDQMLRSGRSDALQGVARRLAHDLNNPLMIVTGYAEEMRNALRKDDPMRGEVDQILTATGRISEIAAQLLAITRPQANPPSPVNITQLLSRLEDKIARALGEKCSLSIDPAGGEAIWAMAEESQLGEILMALTSPEREDARERSHVSIGCDIENISEYAPGMALAPGQYTRLAIQDDGRGLDQTKVHGVFEGFLSKQGEKTAGPALARAYAIVREWGGDISFSSEPLRGSTFLVYLPHHAPSQAPAAPAKTKKAAPPPEIVRKTILLVEDEVSIRALVRKILRRENYNVLEAGGAEEAVAMASSMAGRIDLLITDFMLPAASGRDLAVRLRESRGDLKILYISGYTDDEAVRAGAVPPGSKFLQKPFTLGALLSRVKELLGD